MFERRLKIFLLILFVVTLVLVVRAAQLQILRRSEWNEQAIDALKRTQLIETTRGTVRDFHGNIIATDVACIDACVDYRALIDPPDPQWLKDVATQRARSRRAQEWKQADSVQRKRLVEEEKAGVVQSIHAMFATLAELSNREPGEIDEIRRDIVRRVETARRYTWFRKYKLAVDAHGKRIEAEPSAWWTRWLIGNDGDAPQLDDFDVKVAEQIEAHPILRAISIDVQTTLGKNIDEYPGLVLRPGMTRLYPYNEVACHVVGHLSRVRREDVESDPYVNDELRQYQYSDLIGRTGLEALCEPLLRGTRGKIEKFAGDSDSEAVVSTRAAEPGKDLAVTIDMELQRQVLELFQKAPVEMRAAESQTTPIVREVSVHGGAVLIDVRSGEVRALVSNPTFNPNTLDADYPKLVEDDLEQALMNRATQYPLETGSTIKPVVGLGAITQGLIGVNEGIECTGFLTANGKRYGFGRCWVATKYVDRLGAAGVAHHPIPPEAPHRGHDGNGDGFLTFADALERSCNVYFENVAHKLGLEGLSYWMDRFGLGRPTGIGIEESRGRLPNTYDGPNVDYATYVSGIGQSPVAATALQMANVAATIARDGVWTRPTLLNESQTTSLRAMLKRTAPATRPASGPSWWEMPDRDDLHLSPAALAAAQDGMNRVVNGPAGTGRALAEKGRRIVTVAGKTGTAQAAPRRMPVHDSDGNDVFDEDGRRRTELLAPSTIDQPNPTAPWYLGFDADGKNLKHSWIIGFAPAKNPQVAFAVMVEYGGSGGTTAAHIANGMLDAAIEAGYLRPEREPSMTTDAR